jgi:cellulose synthase/poly-beta-1,6-N-acetylglucosamine synthase-like glycosyltransferase
MPVSALDNMVSVGLFEASKLKEIEIIANEFDYSYIKTALNFGFLTRKKYVAFLEQEGFQLVAVREEEMDPQYIEQCDLIELNSILYAPLRKMSDGSLLVAAADPQDEKLKTLLSLRFKMPIRFVTASDLDITWLIHIKRGEYYVKEAVFSLMRKDPEQSGLVTFTDPQLVAIFGAIAILIVLLFIDFLAAAMWLNIIFSVAFFFTILFKLYLSLNGSKAEMKEMVNKAEVRDLDENTLPIYTILLPVYREEKVIRKLIWNLRSLDYPKGRLDIKLLVEEDDDTTLNEVRNLDFPANFETIVVPFHMPKTKPKACNYGLYFCRGEYLAIYDAEDIPDSDQLKKCVVLFRKLPSDFVVLQGALNYFNKNENMLTRMFTLEYTYWFDYLLPGLMSLDIPIPLGGTSNHFKFDKLMELGGWDPFNVTEDADLGVRVFEKGFKVGIVNSTTLEEANNEPFNWIRQRSRWIKGYMQTSLVHMRNPLRLIRRIGWRGFLGFNFFIAGTSITFLLYPLLLVFLLIYSIVKLTFVATLFPDWVLYISTFNLVAGNTLMIYVNMLSVFKRKYYELILFGALNPLYWIMHSIAAYKGLWQLIFKPFFWEKTTHGLTRVSSSGAASITPLETVQ